MKLFKKNILVMLILLLLVMFIGCHGSKGYQVFAIPEEFDTSRDYEITFWAKNDSNVTQKRIYQKSIEDFQKIYPNIKVVLKSYSDYDKIYNDVITNIATKTTPNVCVSYPDYVATYLSGENIVVPLDGLFVNEKFGFGGSELRYDSPKQDELIDKFMKEGKINNYTYIVPFMRSTEACYVNKTFVEELGYTLPETLTWDFVWEVSEYAMTKKEENQVLIPFIYYSTDNMMIQMLKQKNAEFSTPNGEVKIFNSTTRQLLETIAFHSKSRCFSTFHISSYPGNFFNAGQCIFAIDSTAGSTWIGSEAPLKDIDEDNVVQFETKVMTIPQFDINNPKMISQGPSICIFNKEDPQEILASWIFTQYLLTNDVQIAYSKTEGYVPVTKKAQESEEYKDYLSRAGEVIETNDKKDTSTYYEIKINASKLLLNNIDNTFVTPVFNGSASLRSAGGEMIDTVVKSVRKNQTIDDEYFEKLKSDIIALKKLDQISLVQDSGALIKIKYNSLPTTAIVLLSALGVSWVCIIGYLVKEKIKKKK